MLFRLSDVPSTDAAYCTTAPGATTKH